MSYSNMTVHYIIPKLEPYKQNIFLMFELPPAASSATPIAIIPVELYVLYIVSNTVLPPNKDGYCKLFIAPPPEVPTSFV